LSFYVSIHFIAKEGSQQFTSRVAGLAAAVSSPAQTFLFDLGAGGTGVGVGGGAE
jgi:hypothetical protein